MGQAHNIQGNGGKSQKHVVTCAHKCSARYNLVPQLVTCTIAMHVTNIWLDYPRETG